MNATRLSFVALVWALLATLVIVWNAQAHTLHTPARYIDATVLCPHAAEDSLAHVRLVAATHYPDGWEVLYRCKRNDY